MNTVNKDFPFMNHGQCKLFATMGCTALTVMVPIALLSRTVHLKPFAFAILMPSLCLTIISLVVGILLVFLAEYAGNEYRELDEYLFTSSFDSSNRKYALGELSKKREMVRKCEDWGVQVLQWGLPLSVGVLVALAILMLF
jgi:hypothetical protein